MLKHDVRKKVQRRYAVCNHAVTELTLFKTSLRIAQCDGNFGLANIARTLGKYPTGTAVAADKVRCDHARVRGTNRHCQLPWRAFKIRYFEKNRGTGAGARRFLVCDFRNRWRQVSTLRVAPENRIAGDSFPAYPVVCCNRKPEIRAAGQAGNFGPVCVSHVHSDNPVIRPIRKYVPRDKFLGRVEIPTENERAGIAAGGNLRKDGEANPQNPQLPEQPETLPIKPHPN